MTYNLKLHLFFTLFLITNCYALFGQGWERIYFEQPSGTMEYSASSANRIFIQNDNTYLFAATVENQPKFLSTDENGFITNLVDIPSASGNLIKSTDENYVFAARTGGSSPANEDVYLTKFDETGSVIWTHYPEGFISGNEAVTDLLQSNDGAYVFVGARANISTNEAAPYISKVAEDGSLIWKTVGSVLPENNIYQYKLIETADNGYFIAASSNWFSINNPIITDAIKLDQNGNILWTSNLDTDLQIQQMTLGSDGSIVLLGKKMDYSYSLLKLDANGNTIWEQEIVNNSDQLYGYTSALIPTSDNGFALLINTQGIENNLHLIKADNGGNIEWEQAYGGVFEDNGNDLKQTADGGYIIGGSANGMGEDRSLYIIKTDELGNSFSNIIHGQVQYDLNENCLLENDEQSLENWIVSANSNTGTFYAAVDENGYYSIEVESSSYEVTLTSPNEYWNACVNNVNENVIDTSTVDFAVQSVAQCPLLEVEINRPGGMRLCEESTINIHCQNQGTLLAENAYVEISLHDSLQLSGASIPYTLLSGNTYSFDVGDIDFLTSVDFNLQVNVGCDIELLGQSLCIEAHIYPDTTCLPIDGLWSGASIQLSAECTEDEVLLKIENVGEQDMIQALQYTVIEDHVIMLQAQPFGPLTAGQSITIPKSANGTFYRIESAQVANHPGMSMPSAFIEGCGEGEDGEISLGFINQYPLDDADYFVDLSCIEIIAAYDPNIKEAFPLGYNDEHYIESNSKIDYVIHFQNTGTAIANKVVIMDRLSENLDPSTIRIQGSSHSLDFELLANGVAQFTFNDIQLPDSTANEPASHGYVKFSIQQKGGLAPGSIINNTAAIYFDYNPAIVTNTTYHTIGENFIMVDIGEILENNVAVKVFPNPFMETATIQVIGDEIRILKIAVFDTTGKEILKENFSGSSYIFRRGHLAPGNYFYQIISDSKIINVGKLLVQ